MALTLLFVLIAEILIYVPSIANFRSAWLNDRIAQARAAALILEKASPDALPKALVDELLAGMETTMIALRIDQSRRLLALSDMPPMVEIEIDLRSRAMLDEVTSAFDILLFGHQRTIRVVGPAPRGGEFVEIVINEKPLRAAMIGYSWSVLQLSLLISAIAAFLVFAALSALIVRPVTQLAGAIARFRRHPEDAQNLVQASARTDELGALERALAEMQSSIQHQLRQREHLANLGLAVAKINHDLRNMLSSAQLMADRLGALPDDNVQRFVPKLVLALDRAINFCQSTLVYGRASERAPELLAIPLAPLMRDVMDQLDLDERTTPACHLTIDPTIQVHADAEYLQRVLMNIMRNAVAAFTPSGCDAPVIRIDVRTTNSKQASQSTTPAVQTLVARETSSQTGSLPRPEDAPQARTMIEIDISDNGPGIPVRLRESLFQAFSGSMQSGGSGLGLTIARELMQAMGGSIVLLESELQDSGANTTFRLQLYSA